MTGYRPGGVGADGGAHDLSAGAAPDIARRLDRLAGAVAGLLPRYGLGPDTAVSLLAVSENATFRLDAPGRAPLVLRVHRGGYQSPARIRSELAWVTALRRERVLATVVPVAARDGELVALLADPGHAGPRPAVMFEHLAGHEPAPDPACFQVAGAAAARLHAHARRWAPPPAFTRFRWDHDGALGAGARWGRWEHAPGVGPSERAVLARLDAVLARRLGALDTGREVFHLLHADLRPANLVLDAAGTTHVIDFDDCGSGWYLYDLAASLSFLEHEPHAPELVQAWLRGYRTVAPVPAAHERAIPTFVLLRRLQLTAWAGTHAHASTGAALGTAFTDGTLRLAEDYLRTPG